MAAALAACWLLAPAQSVLACPVCLGASDTPAVQGMRMAIVFLLGVTGSVLAGFGAFFVYLTRRATLSGVARADSAREGSGEASR